MEAEIPSPSPKPEISPAWRWFLRMLALVCMLMVVWNTRYAAVLAAVLAIPYLLGAWWLNRRTFNRGLVTIAITGIVLGIQAFFSLVMATAVPPEYFDRTPEEMHAKVIALEILLVMQAGLVIATTATYLRTRPRALNKGK